jgi:hypothetical protein
MNENEELNRHESEIMPRVKDQTNLALYDNFKERKLTLPRERRTTSELINFHIVPSLSSIQSSKSSHRPSSNNKCFLPLDILGHLGEICLLTGRGKQEEGSMTVTNRIGSAFGS